MHVEEIKAAMRMRGITQALLADQLGVTRSAVGATISGTNKSPRIQAAIARIIEKPASEIWQGQVRLRRVPASVGGRSAS
ncbi:MAG: helix-turn-helix domain-containing protein [Zoogloeaceae bacterium]|jgi:lambda repressor-like predicted transcriptional regulator|nr:helix-turn-helix domain-containing protein [Zoogloeaceae bacterium]